MTFMQLVKDVVFYLFAIGGLITILMLIFWPHEYLMGMIVTAFTGVMAIIYHILNKPSKKQKGELT